MRLRDVLAAAAGRTPSTGWRWPSDEEGFRRFAWRSLKIRLVLVGVIYGVTAIVILAVWLVGR
jgi:hypothetical protein